MSKKAVKKIGLFASLTMMIGSVVGVGIFFKSGGILKSNDYNGIGTLISWILGGLLSLGAAVSFAEIGSMKTEGQTGLPAWAKRLSNSKFAYFVRFNYSFYYYGLLASAVGFYASEALFNVFACVMSNFSISDLPIYVHVIVGLVISIGFIAINFFSIRTSGMVQKITTILKWIPLLSVGLLGIIFATNNYLVGTGGNPMGHNSFTNGRAFTFSGMLAAVPAVLFAFDSFLTAANMTDKIKGGVKTVPFVVITGMVACLALYLLIAISAILHGTGYVSSTPLQNGGINGTGIFDQLFPRKTAILFGQIVTIFLFISTVGVLNGITCGAVTMINQSVKCKTVLFSDRFKDVKFIQLYYCFATYLFWYILYAVTAIPLNSDAAVDGLSNFSTLFFFGIYVTIIILYTLKRDKITDNKKMNNILFKTFAWIAIVGIVFFVSYQLIYRFFIDGLFIHPNSKMGWGIYVGAPLKEWQGSIIFFSMLTLFMGAPYLNRFAMKKIEKIDVYQENEVLRTK